jgi:hypothetical protein
VQLTLVHDVELHALAGRQAHRAVSQVGEPIEGQPLLGRQLTTGDGRAHHAGVVERQLLARPLAADVAVVLLVDPVELEHDLVVVVEAVGALGQLLGDGAAQVAAGSLDVLDAHAPTSLRSAPSSLLRCAPPLTVPGWCDALMLRPR